MREGIIVEVSAADQARLEAMVADRNSPQKHVWRARIVLLTAAGHGTVAIMRQAGVSKVADIDRMPFRPNHIFDSVVDIDIV